LKNHTVYKWYLTIVLMLNLSIIMANLHTLLNTLNSVAYSVETIFPLPPFSADHIVMHVGYFVIFSSHTKGTRFRTVELHVFPVAPAVSIGRPAWTLQICINAAVISNFTIAARIGTKQVHKAFVFVAFTFESPAPTLGVHVEALTACHNLSILADLSIGDGSEHGRNQATKQHNTLHVGKIVLLNRSFPLNNTLTRVN